MEIEKQRLNKYLSDMGVCSRREADRLVEAGKITIDGHKAALGEKVDGTEQVVVNGKPLEKKKDKKVILAYNKPIGIVCSTTNQGGEKNNIVDAVKYPTRVYPVGRLDKDSEGLIFLTNDGNIVNRIMRAGNKHEKEYIVTVKKAISQDFLQKMQKGVQIEGGNTRPCKVIRISDKSFRIILTQGMNRQIRRMCEVLTYDVVSLKRVRIMNVKLGELKTGTYRELTKEEMDELYRLTAKSRN